MAKRPAPETRIAADNRKARFNYAIESSLEAGIELFGTEVKALREGKANIGDAYATPKNGELLLMNSYIAEYGQAGSYFQHEPRHKRELSRLMIAVERQGMTLVPLRIYFNDRGRAKIEIAVARGKKLHDKRESDKARTWQRDKARLLRDRG